jgi:exonuclease SbcD
MKELTFLHCADLHLDSPFLGLSQLPKVIFDRIQLSTFKSFENLTTRAIEENVDFVVVSGDLFDGEDRSLRAQAKLRNQFTRLQTNRIPVFMIHGNHDHLGGQWINVEMPDNVFTFGDRVERKSFTLKNGKTCSIYGFSYHKRHVWENMTVFYEKGVGEFHIGVLHGSNGSSATHAAYAPFTIQELESKGMDYWALGHIHQRQELLSDPPVVYPGNIQGRHRKEVGPKGGIIVSIESSEIHRKFVESCDIIWKEVTCSLDGCTNLQESLYVVKRFVHSLRLKNQAVLLSIHLIDVNNLSSDQLQIIRSSEWNGMINEGEEEEENWVWVFRSVVEEQTVTSHMRQPFLQELKGMIEQMNEKEWELAVSDLYQHPQAMRFLELRSFETKKVMQKDAIHKVEFITKKWNK